MRRLLVVAVLSVALTGCAAEASAPPSPTITKVQAPVTINGAPFPDKVEVVSVDGHAYIPVTVVPALTGRQFLWDGSAMRVSTAPLSPTRPGVLSRSSRWTAKITQALDILEKKFPEHYRALCENTAEIAPLAADIEPSNLGGFADTTANIIFVSSRATSVPDATVVATLAHEAQHLLNYHTRPDLVNDRREDERSAYRVTVAVLKALGAPAEEIRDAEKWAIDPPADAD